MTLASRPSSLLRPPPPDISIARRCRAPPTPGELLVVTLTTDPARPTCEYEPSISSFPHSKLGDGKWQALARHRHRSAARGLLSRRGGARARSADRRPSRPQGSAEALSDATSPRGAGVRRSARHRWRERIAGDTAFLSDVYAHSASERLWKAPFVRPVPRSGQQPIRDAQHLQRQAA